MSTRLLRALILGCYATVALLGAGMHFIEHSPHADCEACQHEASGVGLFAPCANDGPCNDPAHHHHNHPVHEHDDGCAICSALHAQQSLSAEPIAELCTVEDLLPAQAPRLVSAPSKDLPPGRAPPVA